MYRFIRKHAKIFSVRNLCKSLKIGTSSYYDYLTFIKSPSKSKDLEQLIVGIFGHHKRRYGARRIVSELDDLGYNVGRLRVRTIMDKFGLVAIQPKSFVPKTTQSKPGMRRSPNLLLDREAPTAPNEVHVGDITYLPLKDGSWAYLSTWLDMFSHVIVGWHVEDNLQEELVIRSFKRVLNSRETKSGLIVHSDGGGQYGGKNFRKILTSNGFSQSMTRRDNHYDNATAESLFSRFKAEELEGGEYDNIEDARSRCFEYIDGYYNTQRKHSSIGNKTPLQFEREWKEKN